MAEIKFNLGVVASLRSMLCSTEMLAFQGKTEGEEPENKTWREVPAG